MRLVRDYIREESLREKAAEYFSDNKSQASINTDIGPDVGPGNRSEIGPKDKPEYETPASITF